MLDAFVKLPLLESLFAIALFFYLKGLWDTNDVDDVEDNVQERAHGQAAVIAQLQGIITAATIIMGSVGAFSALLKNPTDIIKAHVVWASIWVILSISTSVWAFGMLPYRALRANLVKSREVTFMGVFATIFLLFGCFRFGVLIYIIIFS